MIKSLGKIVQIWSASGIILCSIATASSISAQIVPDATLPVNSSITTQGNTNIISGGTQAGGNLFHSFEQFSIPTDGVAYFNNAPNIQNIISRVTGASVSNIDGAIGANGSANLFLLNPNGIIFGSKATLNIGGSFVASTASSLNFADGNQFSASSPQATPLLSVSVPVGLQFGQAAQSIRVGGDGQGVTTTSNYIDIGALSGRASSVGSFVPPNQTSTGLRVKPNQTLALVGGDVVLEGGTLKASGGRIELGSVAGSSFVNLAGIDKGYALDYQDVSAFKDINLSQKAAVDASGAGGGNIQVWGRRVAIANGSQIEASTLGAESGSTLSVNASESLELTGTSNDGMYFSGLIARVAAQATGAGGNLSIETSRLIVRDGGIIATSTRGDGQGGNLTVEARDLTQVSGISADGRIPSGLFTTTELQATGAGGNLNIETNRLAVQNRAVVVTATTSKGTSGNLDVKAADVQISGGLLSAATTNVGKAGNLNIDGNLTIQNQARVSVASRGLGQAGNLKLTSGSIKLDNGSSITAASGEGSGGNIQLQAQDLLLQGNSEITAKSGGDGGNLTIDTDLLVATENSTLKADAVLGKGGNVRIKAEGLYISPSPDSQITATSERGTRFNGVVEINTPDLEFNSALASLPAEVVDVSGLVAAGCPGLVGEAASQFVVIGRGGLPPTPREAFGSESPLVDLGTSVSSQKNRPIASTANNSLSAAPAPLVEAQGWVISDKGQVILTASAPTVIPRPRQMPISCQNRPD